MNKDKISFNLMLSLFWIVVVGFLTYAYIQQSSSVARLKSQVSSLKTQVSRKADTTLACRVSGGWKAGQFSRYSVQVEGMERSSILHLPKDFVRGQYYPVVFFYVGKGGDAMQGAYKYNVNDLPAIVVYGEPLVGRDGVTAWDGAPYESSADDIAYTNALIGRLKQDLCINQSRIYAVGMSNGGGFAAYMSCKAPGQFAAIAIISGAMYPPEDDCNPQQQVPILNVHGTADTVIPYGGWEARKLPPIDNWMDMRAKYAGCEAKPYTREPTQNFTETVWNKCHKGVEIQNIRVNGGVHAWGNVSNDVIWRFLWQFSLPPQH